MIEKSNNFLLLETNFLELRRFYNMDSFVFLYWRHWFRKTGFAIGLLLDHKTVPGIGWIVIVEFQFYLLFPFLLLFSQKMGVRYLVGLVLMALAIRWCIWYKRDTVQDLACSTIFGRIDQFLLGMLACEALRKFSQYFKSPLVLASLIVAWSFINHRFDTFGGYLDNHEFPSQSTVWVYLPTLDGVFYVMITAA